jgi:recombinational DNA repair protein RecR
LLEKNCDNCKNYNTYFDCGQCEDFDEWEERINVEEFKPTKRKFWRLRQLHEEQQQLYKVKNQKYGDSFGISVQKYGLISALTRMSDKWNRIENLILNNDSGTDDESLIDSLKDLANYCNMTIIEMEGKHKY